MTARWPQASLSRAWPPPELGWDVGYEVDFSALPTTAISNGANALDAVPWTATNAANADTFAVTAGTGLRIAPKTGTQFSKTAQTAPLLEAKLKDLVGAFDRADRLFVQVKVASAGLSADGQSYGLQVGAGGQSGGALVGMYEMVHTGGALYERTTNYKTTLIEVSVDTAIGSEPAFLALWCRTPAAASRRATAADLVGGSAWPHPRDTAFVHGPFNFTVVVLGGASAFDPDTAVMRLWAERDGTPGAFTATFEGLRVLVQRWGT